MLTNVKLINFKSHRDTELNFDDSRLHALVGQNSSGKTSILQGLAYLSQLVNSSFEEVFTHQKSPQSITAIGQDHCSVAVGGIWKDQDNPMIWSVAYDFRKIEPRFWIPAFLWKLDGESKALDKWDCSIKNEIPIGIFQALKHTVNLKLIAANLAKAAYSESVVPQVESDGSALGPTLDYLRGEAPDRFRLLEEMLIQIVPSVRRVGTRRAKVITNRQRLIEVDGKSISYEESQEVVGQEVALDMNTGDRIPAHAISEGTMLALGLLTVLMSPEQPNLVLLDDVEQGLHPKAQRELMSVFKQIIQANPNLQIIFSTHSPYIVDELTPSQVHVLSNTNSGFTRCKRLDEHPDVEWAKQTLTTGEFWDAEGEDWVTAGEVNA
jgi:Fe-S cluster assembly ATPase SufC